MLAFVFWSTPISGNDVRRFEDSLSCFHEELNDNRVAGFRRSVSFRVTSKLPWLRTQQALYEDWYLLSNFAAMDRLDQRIADAHSLPAHRRLMQQTGDASGAVVYLDKGSAYVEKNRFAWWFARSRAVTATELVAAVQDEHDGARSSVWTRAMALGPAGTCLLADVDVEDTVLPTATKVDRTLLWAP